MIITDTNNDTWVISNCIYCGHIGVLTCKHSMVCKACIDKEETELGVRMDKSVSDHKDEKNSHF